jgi:hypothetical protein
MYPCVQGPAEGLAKLRVGVPVGCEGLGIVSLDHEEDACTDATLPHTDQMFKMDPASESRRIRKKGDVRLHQRHRFDFQVALSFSACQQEVHTISSHDRLPLEDLVPA